MLPQVLAEGKGRKGDRPFEGSRSAKLRTDEQKPHTRLSPGTTCYQGRQIIGSDGGYKRQSSYNQKIWKSRFLAGIKSLPLKIATYNRESARHVTDTMLRMEIFAD